MSCSGYGEESSSKLGGHASPAWLQQRSHVLLMVMMSLSGRVKAGEQLSELVRKGEDDEAMAVALMGW